MTHQSSSYSLMGRSVLDHVHRCCTSRSIYGSRLMTMMSDDSSVIIIQFDGGGVYWIMCTTLAHVQNGMHPFLHICSIYKEKSGKDRSSSVFEIHRNCSGI